MRPAVSHGSWLAVVATESFPEALSYPSQPHPEP